MTQAANDVRDRKRGYSLRMRRRDLLMGLGAATVAPGCRAVIVRAPRLPAALDPVTPAGAFYVFSCCGEPTVDAAAPVVVRHDAEVLGAFDLAYVASLPALAKEHTLQCVGSNPQLQLISNGAWTVVRLDQILDSLGVEVPEDALQIVLWGHDGYHAMVPLADLADAPLFVAYALDDSPLSTSHGFPLRVLAPNRYGMKNVKWLAEVTFVSEEHVSFYTPEGWSESAEYQPNGFVASPPDGLELDEGDEVKVLGTAFAGADPIASVDVSIDGGPWQPATLDYTAGADIWALWSYRWSPPAGRHTLQVRVTTASGRQSSEDPAGTDQLAGYDGGMQITVRVG